MRENRFHWFWINVLYSKSFTKQGVLETICVSSTCIWHLSFLTVLHYLYVYFVSFLMFFMSFPSHLTYLLLFQSHKSSCFQLSFPLAISYPSLHHFISLSGYSIIPLHTSHCRCAPYTPSLEVGANAGFYYIVRADCKSKCFMKHNVKLGRQGFQCVFVRTLCFHSPAITKDQPRKKMIMLYLSDISHLFITFTFYNCPLVFDFFSVSFTVSLQSAVFDIFVWSCFLSNNFLHYHYFHSLSCLSFLCSFLFSGWQWNHSVSHFCFIVSFVFLHVQTENTVNDDYGESLVNFVCTKLKDKANQICVNAYHFCVLLNSSS